MAYKRTVWKNREVERPRTYEKIENPDGTITLIPSEGTIIEEGTPIIADNMNNIEQGIEDAHNAIDEHKADNFHHIPYAIATGTNSYTVNIQGITALTEGMSIKVRFQNANTGTCTLNINGLGAKQIHKSNGYPLSAGDIKSGQILHLVYTGSVFQSLGEGGEYGNVTPGDVIKGVTFGTEEGLKTGTLELTGNATTSQVLTGRTFYTTNPKSKLTGTMPNRAGDNNALAISRVGTTLKFRPPAGYYDGVDDTVQYTDPNWVPANILSGKSIFGLAGTAIDGSNKKSYAYATVVLEFEKSGSYYNPIPFPINITVPGVAFTPSTVFITFGNKISIQDYFDGGSSQNIFSNKAGLTRKAGNYIATFRVNMTKSGTDINITMTSTQPNTELSAPELGSTVTFHVYLIE